MNRDFFEDYLYHANKNGLKKICRELLSENEQLKKQIEELENKLQEFRRQIEVIKTFL